MASVKYRAPVFVKRVVLDDFKAYQSADIELKPLTLILGPNGTGKTTVLQAFELLAGLVDSNIKAVLEARDWDYSDLSHLKTKTKLFGFEVELADDDGAVFDWSIRLGHKRGPGVAAESVSLDGVQLLERKWRTMKRWDSANDEFESITQTLTQSWLSAVTEEDAKRFPELLRVANWARGVDGYIELQPAELRTSAKRTDDGVGHDGGKLAGFLAFLQSKHPDRFEAVLNDVREVYPRLVDVELKTARGGWVRLNVVEKWGRKQLGFNAQQVSDGLLRLLAVAAMAQRPDRPSLVMIDEIENGLHPHLLDALIRMLQRVADRGTQVIATTHSPVALNFVDDPSQVLIARRDDRNGDAGLVSLSRSMAWRRVADVMEPGEAWYNLGEERLLRSLANS